MKELFRVALLRLLFRSFALACVLLAITGCMGRKAKSEPAFTIRPTTTATQTNVIITPMSSPVGRVTSVNQQAGFLLASFPIGQLPPSGTRLSIYRAGEKVGEVKMSDEALETSRAGDITSGSAQIGDEVRSP